MSAPPLIWPPTKPVASSRRKFPGLRIPNSESATPVIGPPDDDTDMSGSSVGETGSSQISPSSAVSGLFSAELLAAVRPSDGQIAPHKLGLQMDYEPSAKTLTPSYIVGGATATEQGGAHSDRLSPMPNSMASRSPSVPNTRSADLDVDDLDEEGWSAVARAKDIIVLGRIGEGSGGSVSRCRLRCGTTVFALKEITTNPNPELQRQILRELQFNQRFSSPHIVKYYGTFLNPESASICIAMEYCGGGSLEAIYKRVRSLGGRIGEKVLGKIAEGVLSGLSYLHERRVIHRDIKPQNILLDSEGQVKLCDFGVSGEVVDSLATTFTGTSYYMAPERIQGQPYTVTSDVWSLGLTLMEVAQHRFPFLAEGNQQLTAIELLTVIVNMPAPELKDEPMEGIQWTESFRHFLKCCLEKDPKKRASPRQMLDHPWMRGQRQKTVKMDQFVRECWSR